LLILISKKKIIALTPLEYFKDVNTGNFFVSDGDSTWLFENGSKILIYKNKKPFVETIMSYDTTLSILENEFQIEKTSISIMPIVEWSYHKVSVATPTSIYSLELEQIFSMSYAVDAGNTKQTHQPVLQTDEDTEQAKLRAKPFGKSRKMLLLGADDVLKPYDAGTLQPLLDIISAYEKLSIRKAIAYGVSKDSVVPSSKIESGEALKVALGYVNKKRKKFFFSGMIFERKVIDAMKELGFMIKNYKGIKFKPISVIEDEETTFKIVSQKYKSGFISFREAIARDRGISLDDADKKIKEEGLQPIDILFKKEE
jgi:hypothetical protein